MKYGKILLNIMILIVTGIVTTSCSTTPRGYSGEHSLYEEYSKDKETVAEKITDGKMHKKKTYYGPKEMIAVMDFSPKDIPYSVAMSVSELIRTELINTGKYTVIERSQMKEILKEQGFQQTGCTDTSCAVQVGKLLSAKKILVGSVMKLGSKLIISGRIVDVEKGIGEQGASGKANSVDELDTGVIEFINKLSGL